MKLDKKTLFWVLLALLLGMSAIDVDHFIIIKGVNEDTDIEGNGNMERKVISLAPIKCMWYGFLSITSQETKVCKENKDYGGRFLHYWHVGILLFGFIISYYVVLKNNREKDEKGRRRV